MSSQLFRSASRAARSFLSAPKTSRFFSRKFSFPLSVFHSICLRIQLANCVIFLRWKWLVLLKYSILPTNSELDRRSVKWQSDYFPGKFFTGKDFAHDSCSLSNKELNVKLDHEMSGFYWICVQNGTTFQELLFVCSKWKLFLVFYVIIVFGNYWICKFFLNCLWIWQMWDPLWNWCKPHTNIWNN